MARVVASLSPSSVPGWAALRREFGDAGAPGLTIGDSHIAYRTRMGRLVGILVVDDHGFVVRVNHGYRRRGIASRLLVEALCRWPLDLVGERYTTAGAAWVNAYFGRRAQNA